MFKGVAFDLDGVITDTAFYHAKAWQVLCQELGVAWTQVLAEGTKGVSRKDSLQLILQSGQLVDQYSAEEKEELLERKNNLYKQLIQDLTPADILPGISQLLTDLRAKKYQIVLASASFNAPFILEKLGLTDFFDGIVDPGSLVQGKPHPDIYLKAAQMMQIDPSEMIGIEDAASGVQAIKDAGATVVGVGTAEILHLADINVADTSELTLDLLEASHGA